MYYENIILYYKSILAFSFVKCFDELWYDLDKGSWCSNVSSMLWKQLKQRAGVERMKREGKRSKEGLRKEERGAWERD